MECIREIECLGEFCSCDPINTGLISTVTGTIVIKASFNGMLIKRTYEAVAGSEIVFDNFLNEDYKHEVAFFHNGVNIFGKWFTVTTTVCVGQPYEPYASLEYSSSEYSLEYL